MTEQKRFYVLTCDGDFDQIVEGYEYAVKEKKDLQRMGFVVRIKGPMTGEEADNMEEKMRNR